MVENTKKKDDIYPSMRTDIDVTDIGLLEAKIFQSKTFSGRRSFAHPLGSGIQCSDVRTTQGCFDCVNAFATCQVENPKLVERFLREIANELHHSSHFNCVSFAYLRATTF